MKPRTCPYCKHQMTYKKYIRTLFFHTPDYIWKCENCKKPITFNFWNRLLLAVLTGLWVFVIIRLKEFVDFNVINMIGLILVLLAGQFAIFYFDYFSRARKR